MKPFKIKTKKLHITKLSLLMSYAMITSLSLSASLSAQDTSTANNFNLNILESHCKAQTLETANQVVDKGEGLMLPLKLLYGFYRNSISEQFSSNCPFELSCSRFARSAISRFGIIKGGFLGIDRLTRCHSFVSLETVPVLFNNKTGKVFDDPEMY